MGNMQRDPEPDGPSYDRLVYWFSSVMNRSTDDKARYVTRVLLADVHWAVDEIRAQRKRIVELEAALGGDEERGDRSACKRWRCRPQQQSGADESQGARPWTMIFRKTSRAR